MILGCFKFRPLQCCFWYLKTLAKLKEIGHLYGRLIINLTIIYTDPIYYNYHYKYTCFIYFLVDTKKN